MASENKSTAVPKSPSLGDLIMEKDKAQTAPKTSLSDTQARDSFIGIALREILSSKIDEYAQPKQAAMIATWAVRIANEVMLARGSETAPLPNVVVAKSTVTANAVPTPPPATVEGEQPKSIAEIIGETAPAIQELPA